MSIKLKFSKNMQLKNQIKKPSWKMLDDMCRQLIYLRDGLTCRRCGRKRSEGYKIEWAHFIGRANKAVRHDLDNSCCLCFNCHYKFMHGHDGIEYEEKPWQFWQKMIGKAKYDALQLRSNNKAPDRNMIKLYLLQEEKKIKHG